MAAGEETPGTQSHAVIFFGNNAGTEYELVQPNNPLPVTATITPSGTQNVNITQIGGAAVPTGAGATSSASERVTVAQDSTTVAGSASIPVGTNLIGKVGIDQTTPGVTNAIAVTNSTGLIAAVANRNGDGGVVSGSNSQGILSNSLGYLYNGTSTDRARTIQGSDGTGLGITAVATAPNSSVNSGITPVENTVVGSNVVVKGSAGNLYGFNAVSGASQGYLMVFNSTTAPADGTVTPVKCYVLAANSSLAMTYNPPLRFSTGITLVFSTTGPFLKTASVTAFLSGDAV